MIDISIGKVHPKNQPHKPIEDQGSPVFVFYALKEKFLSLLNLFLFEIEVKSSWLDLDACLPVQV
jgi:hypothetical protein